MKPGQQASHTLLYGEIVGMSSRLKIQRASLPSVGLEMSSFAFPLPISLRCLSTRVPRFLPPTGLSSPGHPPAHSTPTGSGGCLQLPVSPPQWPHSSELSKDSSFFKKTVIPPGLSLSLSLKGEPIQHSQALHITGSMVLWILW